MLCPTDYKIRTVGRNCTNMVAYGYVNWRISAKGKCKAPSRYTQVVILGDTKLEDIIPCRTGFARRIINKLTPTDIKRGM